MKKIRVIWFALLAVFAFGAFSATSTTFAAPEILADGAKVPGGVDLALELSTIFLLSDVGTVPILDAECTGIFDALVEAPGTLLSITDING
jgi:hypothetical protein